MRRALPALTLALLLAAFLLGLGRLVRLRFARGDVYPPYSSLRSDPLGTRVLYEALHRLPDRTVRRFLAGLERLPDDPRLTLLILGAEDVRASGRMVETEAPRGARVVVAFTPRSGWPAPTPTPRPTPSPTPAFEPAPEPHASPTPRTTPAPAPPPWMRTPVEETRQGPSFPERFGFAFGDLPLPRDDEGHRHAGHARRALRDHALPESISWHSSRTFTDLDPAWTVLYARDGAAVLIERRVGRGTLVLSSDTYPFSNEAMLKERHAPLLARLLGSAPRILFDETHLGVAERRGIADLARRYRLGGVLAGLMVLAGLFLWRAAAGLLPPRPDPGDGTGPVAGRGAAAGLVTLLRRGIRPGRILDVCLEEWTRTLDPRHAGVAAEARRLAAGAPGAVAGYRSIARALSRMKGLHDR
jgi:Domain of unknown function (DUF4350)